MLMLIADFDYSLSATVYLPQCNLIIHCRFEGYCIFGDKKYGPVTSQNKQQTKTAAFKLAWEMLDKDPTVKVALSRHTHRINSSVTNPAASMGGENFAQVSAVDTEGRPVYRYYK